MTDNYYGVEYQQLVRVEPGPETGMGGWVLNLHRVPADQFVFPGDPQRSRLIVYCETSDPKAKDFENEFIKTEDFVRGAREFFRGQRDDIPARSEYDRVVFTPYPRPDSEYSWTDRDFAEYLEHYEFLFEGDLAIDEIVLHTCEGLGAAQDLGNRFQIPVCATADTIFMVDADIPYRIILPFDLERQWDKHAGNLRDQMASGQLAAEGVAEAAEAAFKPTGGFLRVLPSDEPFANWEPVRIEGITQLEKPTGQAGGFTSQPQPDTVGRPSAGNLTIPTVGLGSGPTLPRRSTE